jgi:large subunit ribosomal protein L14e
MKEFPVEVGRVVYSKRGRDEGRIFLVTGEIDADFVYIADGDTHRMAKQKKKRRKHLKATQTLDQNLRARIVSGDIPQDHEIRACLSKEEG